MISEIAGNQSLIKRRSKIKMKNKKMLMVLTTLVISLGLSMSSMSWAAEKFKIYWNPNHDYEVYNEVFEQFETKYEVEIEKTLMLWPDFKAKIMADFAAGTVPDLIEVPAPWIVNFAVLGELVDMTQMLADWPESQDWFESTWEEVSFEGKKYGMKLHNTAMGFFINRDHFETAGLDPDSPPQFIEDFKEMAVKASKATKLPGYIIDADPQHEISWMSTSETPFLIENNKIAINTPTITKIWEMFQELIGSGYVLTPGPGASYQAMRRIFIQGGSVMKTTGPWDLGNIQKLNPSLNFSVSIHPYPKGLEPRVLACGTGIAIPEGAKTDLAFELMKMLTQVDIEVQATKEKGMLMPRKTWAQDPDVQSITAVKQFTAILPYAVPFDITANILALPEITWGGMVFRKLYDRIIYLQMEPAEALSLYEEEANKLISERL